MLGRELGEATLHASEITRLDVLAGMRPSEEEATRALLSVLEWHSVDTNGARLAIAATAIRLAARLLTRNVRHFPMSPTLRAPY